MKKEAFELDKQIQKVNSYEIAISEANSVLDEIEEYLQNDDILNKDIIFVEKKKLGNNSNSEIDRTKSNLSSFQNQLQSKANRLEIKLNEINQESENLMKGLKSEKYFLMSIVIHDGNAGNLN